MIFWVVVLLFLSISGWFLLAALWTAYWRLIEELRVAYDKEEWLDDLPPARDVMDVMDPLNWDPS